MYLILCWSYLNHSLHFVGEKKRIKKNSHIESQSQYFSKKSQLDYFPKSFSPIFNIVSPDHAWHTLSKNVITAYLYDDTSTHTHQHNHCLSENDSSPHTELRAGERD